MTHQPQYTPADDTQKFLSVLAPGEEECSFVTHDDTKEKRPWLHEFLHGPLEEHEPRLRELNQQGAAVNVLINQGDGTGHKVENIIGYRAVFLDLDTPADAPPIFPIVPHIVVESSPRKFHCYWVIDEGLNENYYRQEQRILANQYSGDDGVMSPARPMRLPGFYHQKDPSKPFRTRIVSTSDQPAISRQEFEDSFGFLTTIPFTMPALQIKKTPSADGRYLSEIENALSYVPADDYQIWINIGMAIKDELGDDGFDPWNKWSQQSEKYDQKDQMSTWRSIKDRSDGVTIGTLFHYAKEHGWTSSADRVVEEINRDFAVVNMQGKVSIVHKTYNHTFDHPDIEFLSAADFRVLLKNRNVLVNGKKPVADHWLASPDRRQYERVEFLPCKEIDGVFNLWCGYPIKPIEGNCGLYLSHIKDNICDGNEKLFNYVMPWMAGAIQNPSNRAGVSLVMRGDRGTGKGVFVNWFGKLFGRHYIHIRDQEHLTGKFNSHLGESMLVFADEAFWAGDKKSEGVLKGLITEPILPIERKYQDVIKAKNHIHLIIASNDDWVIPAGFDERRFVVLDVSDRQKQNYEYFAAIEQQMKSGGLEALMYLLQNYDTSKVNLRQAPHTSALADQKLLSMGGVKKWWYERLQNGAQIGIDDEWLTEIPIIHMYTDYERWCKNTPHIQKRGQQQFGKKVRKLCPSIKKGPQKPASGSSTKRVRHYKMPSLEVCRAEFEKWFGHPVSWDEGGVASTISPHDYHDDILM